MRLSALPSGNTLLETSAQEISVMAKPSSREDDV